MSVIYQMARLEPWSGKYRLNGFVTDQGAMQAQAHEIYMRSTYSTRSEWIVIASTSVKGLCTMLDRLNQGLAPTSAAYLDRFLQGFLDEGTVLQIEKEVAYDTYRKESYRVSDNVRDVVARAMDEAMGRVFSDDTMNRVLNQEPPDHPTTEGETPNGAAPFTKEEMKLIKSVRWSPQVRKRLKFYKFLKERGVFDDDLMSVEV